MSFMQLLSVGRSFQEVSDRPTPYKMAEQRLLPRFGAGVAESSGVLESPAVPAPTGVALRRVGVREGVRTVAGARGRWVLGDWFRRGRRGGRSLRVVQGELALDTVKVVRNDLMETDFEVVPVPVVGPEGVEGGVGRFFRRLLGKV